MLPTEVHDVSVTTHADVPPPYDFEKDNGRSLSSTHGASDLVHAATSHEEMVKINVLSLIYLKPIQTC